MNESKSRFVSRVVPGGFLLAVLTWSGTAAAQRPENVLEQVTIEQKLDAQVPLDLTFRNEAGDTVTLAQLFRGRPVILTLVYYECPMLCTLVLNGTVAALRALEFSVGNEFDVVTVSIDPDEGPELAAAKKAQYLQEYGRNGAETGWHFLTGDDDSIRRLADAVGFRYVYDEESDQYAHAAGIMLLTPQGRVARYFYGVEYSPRDLRLGLIEAAEERIGSPADQVLLFCYHYDPSQGKYTLAVLSLVRTAGVVTVLALAGLLVVFLRRERQAVHVPARTPSPENNRSAKPIERAE
ncbi:MAG: SCO family protein [Acidobacteriota bacterium]